MTTLWDTIIVGAGPAGLSTALVLSRARRRVLVLDTDRPRNAAAHAMHGVLGHDGLDPAALRAKGRAEVVGYGAEVRIAAVTGATADADGVTVQTADGEERARTLVLATGLLDATPDVPGFDAIYGTSAHTCPYCDGWEHRDEPVAVFSRHPLSGHTAQMLRQWTADVVLLTDGPDALGDEARAELSALGIPVRTDRVTAFEHEDGRLQRIRFADGTHLDRSAVFFFVEMVPNTGLAAELGCTLHDVGPVAGVIATVDGTPQTSVDRVYAVGNCTDPMALVAVAVGDGTKAAVAVNVRLSAEDVAAGTLARA